jgi:hypothetical protein
MNPLKESQPKYIIPIILLFVVLNIPIIMGGIEVWFGWNFSGIVSFILGFIKVILFLFISKALLGITKLDEHPLVLSGVILGVIIMFLNSYYSNYQLALYQKIKYGKAFEIKASELHLKNDLYKTPYIKIINSGIGEVKTFKEQIRPDLINYIEYRYASILNTQNPTVFINSYHDEKDEDLISITDQTGKDEIIALQLPKKHNKLQFINTQQFFVAPKTFEVYYQNQESKFFSFIIIINGIGVLFSFIFLYLKTRHNV